MITTHRKKQTQAESNYKENGPSKTKKRQFLCFPQKKMPKKEVDEASRIRKW
jgi:hypothetical protein